MAFHNLLASTTRQHSNTMPSTSAELDPIFDTSLTPYHAAQKQNGTMCSIVHSISACIELAQINYSS